MAVAWPPMSVLGRLADGDFVKTLPIAEDQAGPDGQFVLRVDPSLSLAEYQEADGTVNFDIYAEAGAERVVHSTSRRLDARARWVDPARPSADLPELALDLGSIGARRTNVDAPVMVPSEDKVFPCPDFVEATYNQRWVAIGETYPGPVATAEFKYETGSSSTLGIGFSATGQFGSFKSSGSASNSDSVVIDWPVKPKNSKWLYKTTFQYKKFDVWVWNGSWCMRWGYEVRPTAFQGGVNSYQVVGPPTANNCSQITGGSWPVTITKNGGSAIEWSNAVTLGSVIGIDLSGKTGFNTKTWQTYKFSSIGRLCGSNTTYPTAAQVVGKGP